MGMSHFEEPREEGSRQRNKKCRDPDVRSV